MLVTSICYNACMNKLKAKAGKKRWEGVPKKSRSQQMKAVRGSLDMSTIHPKVTPLDINRATLSEMANGTDDGMEAAILIALSDGNARTKKEIHQLVERICIVATLELNRRDGQMWVTGDYGWFTNASFSLTLKGIRTAKALFGETPKKLIKSRNGKARIEK